MFTRKRAHCGWRRGILQGGVYSDCVTDVCWLRCRLIDELVRVAKQQGCYKVILDCAESNIPFYEKCGLSRKEVQMVSGMWCLRESRVAGLECLQS
jgi:hypothetical protein